MHPAAVRPQEVNPAKLASVFRGEFKLCKVKRGETIALLSDGGTRREYVDAAFAALAGDYAASGARGAPEFPSKRSSRARGPIRLIS